MVKLVSGPPVFLLLFDDIGLRMGGVGVVTVGGWVGFNRSLEEVCCLRPGGKTGARLPDPPPTLPTDCTTVASSDKVRAWGERLARVRA